MTGTSDESPPDQPERHRPIRTFVLRQGRQTEAQKRAFELHWPKLGLDYAGQPRDFDAVFGRQGLHDVGIKGFRVAQDLELHQLVAVEQFARQPAGAHGVVGGVAAGGVGQQGVAVGRQHVEQVGFARVLADVAAADGDRDDLRPGGLGRQAGLFQVGELAGAGEQARMVGLAGDHQRIGGPGVGGAVHAPDYGRFCRSG